jgi:hypothetical protein
VEELTDDELAKVAVMLTVMLAVALHDREALPDHARRLALALDVTPEEAQRLVFTVESAS